MSEWESIVEIERRNRIRLSVFAYAYEEHGVSLIPDCEWDLLATMIDPTIDTGNQEMDDFFMVDFSPHTGNWILNHPQLDGIKKIYERTKGTK